MLTQFKENTFLPKGKIIQYTNSYRFPVHFLYNRNLTAVYTEEERTAKLVKCMVTAQFNIWRAVKLA